MTKSGYKLVFIGAGSFRFAIPCFLNILDFAKQYHPVDLWLVDIDKIALAKMDGILKRILYMHPLDVKIHSTLDRKKALADADYVLISISVGIQRSEWFDIHIPLKFGIPQNTGDTVGPGGIFRGIRTIPVIIDILKDIEELCPNATVLNYTNPQGTLVLAALQHVPKVQTIGLCHEYFYTGSKKFGRFLFDCGIDTNLKKKFRVEYGGVNHFAWITKLEYGGKDIYPQLRKGAKMAHESEKYHRPYNYYMLKEYGYFNYVEDRHIVEFLPRYYNFFNYKDAPFGIVKLRRVENINKQRTLVYKLINWASHPRNSWFLKLFLRPMEGGEKALMMAKDKEANRQRHHVCNVMNNGTIPNLPNNCIIEVPAFFKDDNVQPVKIGALPSPISDWVNLQAKNQQKVVDAAISGDPDKLLDALLSDPMCQFIEDEEKVEHMMLTMLYYERKWLPKFSESIPSASDIQKLKYKVHETELMTNKDAKKEKYKPDPKLKKKCWPNVK